jgi:hypothetical protein
MSEIREPDPFFMSLAVERYEKSKRQSQPVGTDAPITVATVRAALADVIDSGDRNDYSTAWIFWHNESDEESKYRVYFIDQVVARIAELQRLEHR